MLRKSFKVKTHDGRTDMIEFLVNKRVKFLEFLLDLHSEDGALWMNAIHMNRESIGSYFGISSDCLQSAERQTPGIACIPLDCTYDTAAVSTDAYTYVSLDKLPRTNTAASEWQKRLLLLYTAVAMSTADLLQVPISGDEFIESLYDLLLEADVAFASGAASKTLAQHNLRSCRQHMSDALSNALSGTSGEDPEASPLLSRSPESSTEKHADPSQSKFFFLQTEPHNYTAAPPSYDAVLPAFCSVLIIAYRKLCDLELTRQEECVKRIFSIDRRIQKMFIHPVGKALGKAAHLKFVREAYILSTNGLFSELGAEADEANFINDIIAAQVEASAKDSLGETEAKDDKSSESDSD